MKVFFVLFLNFGFILSQNLFFSEYIEGSSYNKALEIFNPAKNEIELTGYQLWKVTNSDGSWTDENGIGSYALDLSGYLIPPNDVLVICRTSFDIDNQSKCDLMNYATLNFNGDDAIALAFNGNIIDVIGIVNGDPGSGYDIAGETNATKDHTLIRKPIIPSGNTNWSISAGTNYDNSEWIILEKDDFTNLGSHICSACSESPNTCNDSSACNFNEEGECTYPDVNKCDCDGNVLDCAEICGGEAKLDNCGNCDNDPANDCVQDCSDTWGGTLTVDECGICNGPGAVYECGCLGIADGTCDCNGNVLDGCNVCAGDNSTCNDCNGILNGTADFDNCGNCFGGDTNLEPCIQDCGGTWGGSLTIDECGVCGGSGSQYECGCEDIPDGKCDCNGNELDNCHVCAGDNSTCIDCNGVLNGTAIFDNCGNCVGGDTGLDPCIQDCTDAWGGSLTIDECGICGGPGDIYTCGCTEIIEGKCDCNGNELDSCNVCAGDNSTCIDCNGVLNGTAILDNCGNCFGGDTNLESCNQDCGGTWGGSLTVDECGICGDPGIVYECGCEDIPDGKCDCDGNVLDCAEICGGEAKLDNCGKCDNDPANDCVQDCSNTWGGSLTIDECGICGDPGIVYECGCEDIPDGKCDCNGNELDNCNICGGDNSTCMDCNGVLDGTAEFDNCGNCVGGDTGLEPCTQDCGGTWGGSLIIDTCGVCGGAGAQFECGCEDISDGKCDCNGNELDNCHVCAGDNSTCIDCNGALGGTADVDNCGNCVEGDTGLVPCIQDCSGALGGSLTIDACGECDGSIIDTLNCDLNIKTVNPNIFRTIHSYPNPFNSTTTISFPYQGYTHIKLDIIDLNGRIIDSIYSGYLYEKSTHTFIWDASENNSGIYIARISENKKIITHKIILLK